MSDKKDPNTEMDDLNIHLTTKSERRSEAARKANAAKTPEQRSEIARKRQAAKTPEQRSESARKREATRKLRKG